MTSPGPVLTKSAARPRPRQRLWLGLGLLGLLALGIYFGRPHLLALYHWRASQQALGRRDLNGALAHLEKCAGVWPDSFAVHFLAARTARRAGLLEEADEHICACQRLEEDESPETTLEYTLLQAQRKGLTPLQEDYLQKRLQQEHPDSLYILEVLSQECMRRDRYVEALGWLDLWLERWPNDAEALVRHGWVMEHVARLTDARSDYEKALGLDPARNSVRLRVAEILLQIHRAGDARTHLEQLHQSQPDDAAVVLALARCLRELGQPGEASRMLDDLLQSNAKDAQALGERGTLAMDEEKYTEAAGFLSRAAELAPFDRRIMHNLVVSLEHAGNKDEAQKYKKRLKAIDDDIKTLGKLIKDSQSNPHSADLRCQAGMIFLRTGQVGDAMRWFATALEEEPLHRGTHEALADHYTRTGDLATARKHRQILEKIGPKR